MKTTGVIRKLDELGRITLPIELRRSLDLDVKDGLEITVQDDCIILKSGKRRYLYRQHRRSAGIRGKESFPKLHFSSGEAGRAECIRSLTESGSLSKLYKISPVHAECDMQGIFC